MARASFYDHPEIYDLLFTPEPRVVEFYLQQAERAAGPILELGCGSGRLLVPIAQRGLDVMGLDSSPSMLERARDQAQRANLQVPLVQGDMRAFALERKFDLVFIGSNSLSHVPDIPALRSLFAAVYAHLSPRGRLVFDVANPDVRALALYTVLAPDERTKHNAIQHSNWGELSVDEHSTYDAATQITQSVWYLYSASRRSAQTFVLNLRSFFPRELELLLESCGFELVERYGDFNGVPFTSESPHQVCVCRPAPDAGARSSLRRE